MPKFRILWTLESTPGGYYDEIDKPTVQEAAWAVAATRSAGVQDGHLPVLVDVQPVADTPVAGD